MANVFEMLNYVHLQGQQDINVYPEDAHLKML